MVGEWWGKWPPLKARPRAVVCVVYCCMHVPLTLSSSRRLRETLVPPVTTSTTQTLHITPRNPTQSHLPLHVLPPISRPLPANPPPSSSIPPPKFPIPPPKILPSTPTSLPPFPPPRPTNVASPSISAFIGKPHHLYLCWCRIMHPLQHPCYQWLDPLFIFLSLSFGDTVYLSFSIFGFLARACMLAYSDILYIHLYIYTYLHMNEQISVGGVIWSNLVYLV